MKLAGKILLVVAVVAATWAALNFSGLSAYLRFETLQNSKEALKAWVDANGVWALGLFTLAYFVSTALSIPGGAILTLTSGFLFGPFVGTLAVNVGATLGALVVFLVTQNILGRSLQEKYRDQLTKFNQAFEREGVSYLLALRLIPAVPFFLVNILAGLTKVKVVTFVWTTFLGILAGSFVYAFAGSNLANISSPSDVLSWPIILSLVLLGLFSLVPAIVSRWQARHPKPAPQEAVDE